MKNIFLIILFISIAFTCYSQEGKWKKATKKNTIESYQKFLSKFPESEFSDDAKQKIIEIEFVLAESTNTITGYKYFLETYEKNDYSEEALRNLIALEFKQAKIEYFIINTFFITFIDSVITIEVTHE